MVACSLSEEKIVWQRVLTKPITRLVPSPDGTLLTCIHNEGAITFLSQQTGHAINLLLGPDANAQRVCFSPDSAILAVLGGDDELRFFDVTGLGKSCADDIR